MAEASVITDYLTALSAQLPAPVVEELATAWTRRASATWTRD